MQTQINKVELLGTVGQITTQNFNGIIISTFSLVTNRCYKSKGGMPVIESTWHRITAYEDRIAGDLSKGTYARVQGSLRNCNYIDREGNKVKGIEVFADSVEVIKEDAEYEQGN